MRRDQLTLNQTVRISPSMRDDLALCASVEGVTVGELIRRAIHNEVRQPSNRALDPFAEIPPEERLQHLHEAIDAFSDERAAARVAALVAEDLATVVGASNQTVETIYGSNPYQLLGRCAGFLQQASGGILRASSRVKALRAVINYEEPPIAAPEPALAQED